MESMSMAFGSFVSFLWAHCCFHLFWNDCFPLCPPTRSLALIRAHFACSLLLISCHSCKVVGITALFKTLRWRGFFKPLWKLSIAASPFPAHPALRTKLSWVAMYVSRSSPFILRVFNLLYASWVMAVSVKEFMKSLLNSSHKVSSLSESPLFRGLTLSSSALICALTQSWTFGPFINDIAIRTREYGSFMTWFFRLIH